MLYYKPCWLWGEVLYALVFIHTLGFHENTIEPEQNTNTMGSTQSSPLGGGGVGVAAETAVANGMIRIGSRVKTQYTREEGGDDRWYSGTITKVFANGHASIKYDDGDKCECAMPRSSCREGTQPRAAPCSETDGR